MRYVQADDNMLCRLLYVQIDCNMDLSTAICTVQFFSNMYESTSIRRQQINSPMYKSSAIPSHVVIKTALETIKQHCY